MPKFIGGNTKNLGLASYVGLCLLLMVLAHSLSAKALSHTNLQLQFQQNQYLAPAIENEQSARLSTVGLHYGLYGSWHDFEAGMNVQGLFAVDGQQYEHVAVPELYSVYNFTPEFNLTLGRQIRDWSEFDEEWGLGIWQPVARWDFLNPEMQGLTGLFAAYKSRQAGVTFFVSPVFIPDQGPDFEVVDGQFRSDNRWFYAPQNEAVGWDEETSVEYKIQKPNVTDVVFRPSWGLKGILGRKEKGPWVQVAYADKPSNQFQVAVEGFQNLSLQDNTHVFMATIHPYVVRHHLGTFEVGYTKRDIKLWASASYEEFQAPEGLKESWERGALNPTAYGGVALVHPVMFSWMPPTWLKWTYMKSQELEDRQQEGLLGSHIESSMSRIPFTEVVGLEWSSKVWETFHKRLLIGMRYLYSVPDQGGLLRAKVQWMSSRNLRWDLGFDVLGSATEENSSGLTSRYRSNDRVVGGVTYVF